MMVAIADYKTVFSEYHNGSTSFIHMLSKPIATTRDAAINQDDTDKLKVVSDKSAKKINTKLVFYGKHTADKVMQLNQLAYHTKQPVCFIDCQRLVNKYIGETEKHLSKLVAQAETENWILFFDEADALFSRRSKIKDTHQKYANQEISYIFKRLSQHHGLSILSISEKSILDIIQHTIDSVITFR
jgi:SpoVK/Ycf46/Vps4 family AAA+-type ATPase